MKNETRLDAQEPDLRALTDKHHSRIFRFCDAKVDHFSVIKKHLSDSLKCAYFTEYQAFLTIKRMIL